MWELWRDNVGFLNVTAKDDHLMVRTEVVFLKAYDKTHV